MNLRASSICRKTTVRILASSSIALVFAVCANAQWTVVNLHPGGATESGLVGGSGVNQAGTVTVPNNPRASFWSGTAASWVDMNPTGAVLSRVFGVSGGSQVGHALVGGVYRPSLWSGTAASWVDLSPAVGITGIAYDASEVNQVGAVGNGFGHASLWSGTAASWVDIHPVGAVESIAIGASEVSQVGLVRVGPALEERASLWFGTAASWVNLHPAGASRSVANAATDVSQVGIATANGVQRASLWFGTAASWVDLNPIGATYSSADGALGGRQVGTAVVGGNSRASLWSGTANSWVDLHAVLPANFSSSSASSIWHDNAFTYVFGSGINTVTGRREALMWIRPITAVQPTSYAIIRGLDFGGNLASLFNSDNDKVFVLCDEFDSNGEIQFISTLPAGTVSQLRFKFEGSASRNDLSQFVRMFNYSTNAYTNVSVQNTTFVDSVVEGTITTGVANYYSGTREVKSRVFWVPQADISNVDGWTQSCDQVLWTMN